MIIPIRLRYSNAYLLKTNQKAILIDTGCKGQHNSVIRAMEKAGIAPSDLSLIVHTHVHPDHCGATSELSQLLNVPTLVHAYEYESLASGRAKGLIAHNWEGRLLKKVVLNLGITQFEPSHQMTDNLLSLKSFGVNATAYLTPGHTSGSISIMDHDSHGVIVGDVLMGGYFFNKVKTHHPRLHYFIQDQKLLKWSLQRLLSLEALHWYPGHGGIIHHARIKRALRHFLT